MKNVAIKNISVGESAEITKRMSLEMVKAFAAISEDFNPVHLDAEYASKTRYKEQ